MNSDLPRSFDNSTNVQSFSFSVRSALQSLAPGLVERRALRKLLTPEPHGPAALPRVSGVLMFHRTVPMGRYELAAWEWGHGPAVLLLHEWNGQAGDLTGWVPALVGAGYRVLAADLPAHGHSSGRQATVVDWRRAVVALTRYAAPVHAVIGQGLGANAAVLAAAQGLPVRCLVLQAPVTDLAGDLLARAAAEGLNPARAAGVLGRFEREAGVGLEALDWRRSLRQLDLPALPLPAQPGPAAIARVLGFLRQGQLLPAAPEQSYRTAI